MRLLGSAWEFLSRVVVSWYTLASAILFVGAASDIYALNWLPSGLSSWIRGLTWWEAALFAMLPGTFVAFHKARSERDDAVARSQNPRKHILTALGGFVERASDLVGERVVSDQRLPEWFNQVEALRTESVEWVSANMSSTALSLLESITYKDHLFLHSLTPEHSNKRHWLAAYRDQLLKMKESSSYD